MGRQDEEIRVGMNAKDLVSGVKVVEILAKKYNVAIESMQVRSVELSKAGKLADATVEGLTQSGAKFTASLKGYSDQYGVATAKVVADTAAMGRAARQLAREQEAAAKQLEATQKRVQRALLGGNTGPSGKANPSTGPNSYAARMQAEAEATEKLAEARAKLDSKTKLGNSAGNAATLPNGYAAKLEAEAAAADAAAAAELRLAAAKIKTQSSSFGGGNGGKNPNTLPNSYAARIEAEAAATERLVAARKKLDTSTFGATTGGKANPSLLPNAVASRQAGVAALQARAEQLNQHLIGLQQQSTAIQQQTVNSVNSAQNSFLIKLVGIQVIHRAISALISEIRTGIQEAAKFSVAIAEIRTISQDAQLPFGTWAESIRRLSNEFGNPILDIAEGTYQAISNQVVKGAESFDFMAKAARFAAATQSSVEDSVNLLSSALKGFQIDASETTRVSAVLFKGIELGRFRAKDLANGFGQVSVVAGQLGVSLEETVAALDILTRNGLTADEAMTQLSGIMNGLIKPSKAMQAALAGIGEASGEGAVATNTFLGTLRKLSADGGKGLSQILGIFNNIRAKKGFAALLDANAVDKELQQIKGSFESFAVATEEVLENPGKKFQIELNKVKTFFSAEFGIEILKNLDNISKVIGTDLSTAIISAFKAFEILVVSVGGAVTAMTALRVAATLGIPVLNTLASSLGLVAFTGGPLALGILALGSGIAYLALSAGQSAEQIARSAEVANAAIAKENQKSLDTIEAQAARRNDEYKAELQEQFQAFQSYASAIGIENDKLIKRLISADEAASNAFKQTLGNAVTESGKLVTAAESKLKSLQASIDRSEKRAKDRAEGQAGRTFEDSFNAHADHPDVQRGLVAARILQLQREAASIAQTDPDLAVKKLEEADKLADRVSDDASRALKEAQRAEAAAKKIKDPEEKHRAPRVRGREGRGQRGLGAVRDRLADDRLREQNAKRAAAAERKREEQEKKATEAKIKAESDLNLVFEIRNKIKEQTAKIDADNIKQREIERGALLETQEAQKANLDLLKLQVKAAEQVNAKGSKAGPAELEKFDQALETLKANSGQLGLSADSEFKLFQELQEKKARLVELSAARQREVSLQNVKLELATQAKLLEEFRLEQSNAQKELDKTGVNTKSGVLQQLGIFDAGRKSLLGGGELTEFDAATFLKLEKTIENLAEQFRQNQDAGTAQKLQEAIFALDNAVRQSILRARAGGNGLGGAEAEAGAKVAKDSLNALAAIAQTAVDQAEKVKKIDDEFVRVNESVEKLQNLVSQLPADFQAAAAGAAAALADKPQKSLNALNAQLETLFRNLESIKKQAEDAGAGAPAAPGNGDQAGFFPNLNTGIGLAAFGGGGRSSSFTSSFGNINVTVNAAGGAVNAREVARSIQREVRLARI